MFFEFLAICAVGLLLVGAAGGLYSLVRLRTIGQKLEGLERRLGDLEAPESLEPRPSPEARTEAEALRDAETVEPTEPIQPAPPVIPSGASGPPEDVAPIDQVEPPATVSSQPAAPVPPATAASTFSVPEPPSSALDWESLIAGRWLNRIGIVAVLLGTAFFLKYAFDNDWIGPLGRVAIGLVAGSGLVAWSQWLLGRGYRYFSEGVTALGGGILYLSLFAAWDFYELIPQPAAFVGMALVTAWLAALAWGRDSFRLGHLALVGGLATPMLLSTQTDRQVTLFTYLAILVAGFLALAWGKRWSWIAPVAWFGVLVYFASWFDQYYVDSKLLVTLLFAALFFVVFALPGVARVVSGNLLSLDEMIVLVVNAGGFGVALHALLYDDHRWWLTVAVLVLGAFHLMVARLVRPRDKEDAEEHGRESAAPRPEAARFLYAALALGFITAAVPIRLEGDWIRVAWAVEGALLVWAGLKGRVQALRFAGVALTGVAALMLFDAPEAGDRLILNTRFLSFAAVAGSLAAAFFWVRASEARVSGVEASEKGIFGAAGIAANVVGVWGLSEEVWNFLGRQQWDFETRLARQMGLSLLWTLLAALLILVGVRVASKALRWQGLVLVGITILKVFLLDLSFLTRAYRIVSFLALGVVLLAVSFLYQRSLRGSREESE